jgi:thiamine biosynthesis lipoprotein
MKQTRLLMGMPVTIEVADAGMPADVLDRAYRYLDYVDQTFSPFKPTSEVSRISRGELDPAEASADMRLILMLAEDTRQQTDGYFDVMRDGVFNPSGLVKGWAIWRAAQVLRDAGCRNFYVDAGGDIQAYGRNARGEKWTIGIRNPFEPGAIVKRLAVTDCGVATSGLYQRGRHIYNPHDPGDALDQVASLTVIGPNVYEADRFATAAFAMGAKGIEFIAQRGDLEGYVIGRDRRAVMTPGFARVIEVREAQSAHTEAQRAHRGHR